MPVTTASAKRNSYYYSEHHNLWLGINHHRTYTGKPITFQNRLYLKAIYLDRSVYIVLSLLNSSHATWRDDFKLDTDVVNCCDVRV